MATLCVRLSDDLYQRVVSMESRCRLTRSQIVRAAIDFGLAKLLKNPSSLVRGNAVADSTPPASVAEISERLSLINDELHLYINQIRSVKQRVREASAGGEIADIDADD